jgi:hypothetical protein
MATLPAPPLVSLEEPMAGVRTEISTAMMRFQGSSLFAKWRTDNPGEFSKLNDYYRGATMPVPTGIKTQFGLGLLATINAGKMADGTYPNPSG